MKATDVLLRLANVPPKANFVEEVQVILVRTDFLDVFFKYFAFTLLVPSMQYRSSTCI